ncbi:carboxymuconolactone decarboxylase family protein [[Kitasatospora] papulosa]|uniref:carboxymuconolactone decarboxylase family protein n=1 Tax=[Kitasatospora] papulosa TaxID=1464011 RepID=UPI0036C0C3F0
MGSAEHDAGFGGLYARGRETFAELLPGGGERLDSIFALSPDLARLAVGTVYGHLHHRRALDTRAREIAALAAIVSSGMCGTPLAVHTRSALAAGVAPAEIVEVVLECAAFAGFPRAVSALPMVEKVFAAADIASPPQPSPREVVLDALDTARRRAATGENDPEDEAFATALRPGTGTAVYTLAPDRALVLCTPAGPAEGGCDALYIRVVDGRVAGTTVLMESAPAAVTTAGDTVGTARHALVAFLRDLDAVRLGPAAEFVLGGPELLDDTTPLLGPLESGVRPRVYGLGEECAAAVFEDPGPAGPLVALAFCEGDRVRGLRVVAGDRTGPGPGPHDC